MSLITLFLVTSFHASDMIISSNLVIKDVDTIIVLLTSDDALSCWFEPMACVGGSANEWMGGGGVCVRNVTTVSAVLNYFDTSNLGVLASSMHCKFGHRAKHIACIQTMIDACQRRIKKKYIRELHSCHRCESPHPALCRSLCNHVWLRSVWSCCA